VALDSLVRRGKVEGVSIVRRVGAKCANLAPYHRLLNYKFTPLR